MIFYLLPYVLNSIHVDNSCRFSIPMDPTDASNPTFERLSFDPDGVLSQCSLDVNTVSLYLQHNCIRKYIG